MDFIYKDDPKNKPLNEFPGLFAMQAHTGFFGAFLVGVWLAVGIYEVVAFKENVLNSPALPIVLISVPFILLWISNLCRSNATDRVLGKSLGVPKSEYEKNVRYGIAALSFTYIVWCSILIWLTGGPFSPFTPFFVMTFTLTLGKLRAGRSGLQVFLFFTICIVLACTNTAPEDWIIGGSALKSVQDSKSHYILLSAFLATSIAVPYFSALRVERRKIILAEKSQKKS